MIQNRSKSPRLTVDPRVRSISDRQLLARTHDDVIGSLPTSPLGHPPATVDITEAI